MPYPCVVAGLDLTDYSRGPQARGWGSHCLQAGLVTVRLSAAQVTVDARVAELVGLVMRANEADGYVYRAADTGAYNCRKIAGTTTWSNHAWGLAIDENWNSNPFTTPLQTDKPDWLVQRWNRYGFAWGGHYSGRKDSMHFEAQGTPAQMQTALARAREELGPTSGSVAPQLMGTQRRPDVLPQPREGQDNGGWDHLCQGALQEAGFYNGAVDGVIGPKTTEAVKDVQRAFHHQTVDGVCNGWVWVAFLAHAADPMDDTTPTDGMVAVEVLQNMLGFRGGELDRSFGPATRRRVEEVQRGAGLPVDGVVGARTREVLAMAT